MDKIKHVSVTLKVSNLFPVCMVSLDRHPRLQDLLSVGPEKYDLSYKLMRNEHILPVLPIKDLINEDGDPTTPYKLATGNKPSVSHSRVLFCPFVVRKSTAHVETKTLNMRHQAQKGFRGIFMGIPQHQKGYLVYVLSTRKVISSYDVRFDESFVSALSYSSRPYAEAMAIRPAVTYTPYATSSKDQTVRT